MPAVHPPQTFRCAKQPDPANCRETIARGVGTKEKILKQEDITESIERHAFEFFFRFSRFEFALKEKGYLTNTAPGSRAAPNWGSFAQDWAVRYTISKQATALIDARPKCQVVGPGESLVWQDVDLSTLPTELEKVIRLLLVIRNNLFHGGKYGADGWDDPARTEYLLTLGVSVLDQMADQAGFHDEYYS